MKSGSILQHDFRGKGKKALTLSFDAGKIKKSNTLVTLDLAQIMSVCERETETDREWYPSNGALEHKLTEKEMGVTKIVFFSRQSSPGKIPNPLSPTYQQKIHG